MPDGRNGQRKDDIHMHDFVYADKSRTEQVKRDIEAIIRQVQAELKDDVPFEYRFIGSALRDMITYDRKSNVGFDFDVNLDVTSCSQKYSPKELKLRLMNAFDRVATRYGYKNCEDSTRVFTIKKVDRAHSLIEHSCDIAVVVRKDGAEKYIRHNKKQEAYVWATQPAGYKLETKEKWLKENGRWNEVRNMYIKAKNMNDHPDVHSRSIYADTVHKAYVKFGKGK